LVGRELRLQFGGGRVMWSGAGGYRRRGFIGLAHSVFIVPDRGDRPAFSIEKEQIPIAAEEFCDERYRAISTGEIEAYDSVAGDVTNGVDAGTLDSSPEQLAEGGRRRRIGQVLIDEMNTRRVVPQGAEQPPSMSGDTNL
jgi:hypothetical protein